VRYAIDEQCDLKRQSKPVRQKVKTAKSRKLSHHNTCAEAVLGCGSHEEECWCD
jgi:hypothetical protein